MLFTASTVAAIFTFLSVSSAIPTPWPQDSNTYEYPATTSTYTVSTGHIEYDIVDGSIYRELGSNKDNTTLVNFYTSSKHIGKTCEFVFEMDGPNPYHGDGVLFDVFRSTKPIVGYGLPDPQSNYRGDFIGRMKAVGGGWAVPHDPSTKKEDFQFPCPPADPKGESPSVSFELAPVGDSADIKWHKTQDGPIMTYW
ncbi:hypothetical protein BDV96DRAFT_383365 [Lophiotrema nucula]|uniref:Ubiquitin 3 binding protein But2 C-terminal domain-containing protein n=1 Tax=Lophiotrema nucula TaxID=690887 RepID=A0A6A5ZFU2_9PLEO|nr:hypothetical protein BDV96DRAFT_383365 [Lophiotrema nucula]